LKKQEIFTSSDNFLTRSNLIDSKASTKGKICTQVKQDIRKHAARIMFMMLLATCGGRW